MGDGSSTPIDANIGIPQPEATPQPVIVPREIEGLAEGSARYGAVTLLTNRIINDTSAAYLGEDGKEFNFTRPKIRDVFLRTERPRNSSSPALITNLHSESDDPKMRELFEKRATEHNAAEILQFLREGGKVEDLVVTPFMPDLLQLQKMAREAGPLQANESLEVPSPKSEVSMNPTTVRQLVLYGLSADAVKPGFKPFLTERYSSITQAQRDEFLTRLRTGQFYKRQFDDMMRLIPEADRQAYTEQFDLLKKESGVRDAVFENGNDLGDSSLKGPWKRNY